MVELVVLGVEGEDGFVEEVGWGEGQGGCCEVEEGGYGCCVLEPGFGCCGDVFVGVEFSWELAFWESCWSCESESLEDGEEKSCVLHYDCT